MRTRLLFMGIICLVMMSCSQPAKEAQSQAIRIGMTSVFVDDVEKAFTFYTEVLGFVEVEHVPEARLAVVASAADSGGTALLLEPDDHPLAGPFQAGLYEAGIPAMVLSVPDIHREYARLTGLGVTFRNPPKETPWGILALFDDQCGNWIQLHQKIPV